MASSKRQFPTGECWCGCGAETPNRSFFLQGHDRIAESAVIKMVYGDVPGFLVQHGYGPNGKNPKQEIARWRSEAKWGSKAR